MKIAIITGSYPPDTDGIGDYTCQLVRSLSEQGITAEVILRDSWHLGRTPGILDSIKKMRPDLVHIQYPTSGYGWHLTPQFVSLAVPCVVTVHEVSKAHVLRKLSLIPFSLRSRHIIFTTPGERNFSVRYAPWISQRSSVIPIGSAIRTGRHGRERDLNSIVYFGLIRPNKGVEDVVRLAELLKERKMNCRVHVIGKPFPPDSPYYREMRMRSEGLPVTWSTDLDDEKVADILSESAFAYMPFPDGASGRRSSLLALIANGVVTITTRGPQTPSSFSEAALFAQTPEEVVPLLQDLMTNPAEGKRLSEKAYKYSQMFSWPSIAEQHLELYAKLLGERSRSK